jgi:threonine/homoserine/homoserine lactone efflux protein
MSAMIPLQDLDLRRRRVADGTDAGAEHDLPDLAFDLSGTQGRCDVVARCGGGFFVHLFAAAAGLTAVFLAVPMAYEVLKWAGALYLLWLAWQALKPGARSPFEAQQLPRTRRAN